MPVWPLELMFPGKSPKHIVGSGVPWHQAGVSSCESLGDMGASSSGAGCHPAVVWFVL